MRENDFDALSELMKDPEWRPMSSLLLLLSWEQCKNMQSAKKLLDTLYHPQVPYRPLSSLPNYQITVSCHMSYSNLSPQ